jgi:DNA-binding HxlR family transcriptional regulator
MQRSSFGDMQCSVARTLDIVGDTWTPLVLRDIALGISRFDAIQRNLGLSRKVLAQRLRSLEEHGIVARTAYQDSPVRHDYRLTEKGKDLAMILIAMQRFGDKWVFGTDNAPIVWHHLGCGQQSEPVVCCDRCGEPVGPDDALPAPGPGFDPTQNPELTALLSALSPGAGS